MENFQFCVPTNILFGKGQISNLPDAIGGFGKKVLLTYGGGSIKKMGLYDKVKALCRLPLTLPMKYDNIYNLCRKKV